MHRDYREGQESSFSLYETSTSRESEKFISMEMEVLHKQKRSRKTLFNLTRTTHERRNVQDQV